MRRRMVVLFVMMTCVPVTLCGQTEEELESVTRWAGSDVEDMDGDEVERLCDLMRRPLKLNISSHSDLLESELLSRYQVASLLDYRKRNGWVMSLMELAAVDGFGEDFVKLIKPFISLAPPSMGGGGTVKNEALLRTVLKTKDGHLRYSYSSRYIIDIGESLSASVSLSHSLDAMKFSPDLIGGYMKWSLHKYPIKVILGDFNARFGQGLSLWNGMVMNAYEKPSSFMKRSSGVTASGSVTGKYAFTGIASMISFGQFVVSAMFAAPGIKQIRDRPDKVVLMPAANLTYNWRAGQVGLTHYSEFSGFKNRLAIPAMKTSADMAMCIRGIDVFSELTYDWVERCPAGVFGVTLPAGDILDVAAALRFTKDEYALAMSWNLMNGKWMCVRGSDGSQRRNDLIFSADVTFYPEAKTDAQNHSLQIKIRSQWKYVISESLSLILRLTERARSWGTRYRTDLRTDIKWTSDIFSSTVRFNILSCKGTAFMSYAEGGCSWKNLSAYLRQGVFLVDDWDDRIYVYERDVPGSFNVPACYGRGLWTSFVSSWKPVRWLNLYARLAYTSYPFMKKKKPGRAELSFQLVSRF